MITTIAARYRSGAANPLTRPIWLMYENAAGATCLEAVVISNRVLLRHMCGRGMIRQATNDNRKKTAIEL